MNTAPQAANYRRPLPPRAFPRRRFVSSPHLPNKTVPNERAAGRIAFALSRLPFRDEKLVDK